MPSTSFTQRHRRVQVCTALVIGAILTAGCEPEDGSALPMAPPFGTPGANLPGPSAPPTISLVLQTTAMAMARDLAFNPRVPGQLWVVHQNGVVTIVHDAHDANNLRAENRRDRNYAHFMSNPSALAFGGDETNANTPNPALAQGTFATCHENRNGGNDFMGPVLWSSDLSVFAVKNGELGSHLDMLHESPLCMGIAWAGAELKVSEQNVYWVVNGLAGSLDRYDFQKDHGFGNDDHADGLIHRFVPGQIGYQPGVPSHLAFRPGEDAVYVADTAKSRILKLTYKDAKNVGQVLPNMEQNVVAQLMGGETLVELVTAASGIVRAPSGLELRGSDLFVSDNETGDIVRLNLEGKLQARYPTGLPKGSLAGMAFGPDNKLYFVDMPNYRVMRIDSSL